VFLTHPAHTHTRAHTLKVREIHAQGAPSWLVLSSSAETLAARWDAAGIFFSSAFSCSPNAFVSTFAVGEAFINEFFF
jgi:hypothetical protein